MSYTFLLYSLYAILALYTVNVRWVPLIYIVSLCIFSCVDIPEDGLSAGRNIQHICEGNFMK